MSRGGFVLGAAHAAAFSAARPQRQSAIGSGQSEAATEARGRACLRVVLMRVLLLLLLLLLLRGPGRCTAARVLLLLHPAPLRGCVRRGDG